MTNAQNMTISAVIPAYNCEKYIARSIDSVLNQTRPVNEIIVVDDGSTDHTAQIVKSYGDQVRYIYQENAGVSAARNTGIQAASCDWIAFLDADDEWLPAYLDRQIRVLQEHPDLVWTISNFFTCSCSENRRASRIEPDRAKAVFGEQSVIDDFLFACLKGFRACSDTIIIKKEIFNSIGMFKTDIHKGEDLDMWWRIAYRYPRIGLNIEPLAVYHLAVEGSGNKRVENWRHYYELISEHLVLAEKYDRLHSYKPLAADLVCGWMRSMLFGAEKENIRQLLRAFHALIPAWYRTLMYVLTVYPRMTQRICLFMSKMIRKLHLRRQVVLPPPEIKN